MRLLSLVVVAMSVVSCSSTPLCGPGSCSGCCDSSGTCVTGNSPLTCGAAGSACAACRLGDSCVLGQCSGNGSGGGAATGGGGAAATGGGGGSATGGGDGTATGGGGSATGGGGGAALKPNVMFVVDMSGSMLLPINSSAPGCPSGCGSVSNPCPGSCPTRISELRSSLTAWLTAHGDVARMALTTFPAGSTCEVPASPLVPLPEPTANDVGTSTALQQHAGAMTAALGQVSPVGGTPTGATLGMLSSVTGLQANDGREDLVVLLTDGLPNCNSTNVNNLCSCGTSCTTAQQTACACTTSSCGSSVCSIGCLDSTETIAAVGRLRTAGVKTVVIAFGADLLTGSAPGVLDAMARSGGAPRSCPAGTSAECGGQTCRADHTCEQAHYTASNGIALTGVLDSLF